MAEKGIEPVNFYEHTGIVAAADKPATPPASRIVGPYRKADGWYEIGNDGAEKKLFSSDAVEVLADAGTPKAGVISIQKDTDKYVVPTLTKGQKASVFQFDTAGSLTKQVHFYHDGSKQYKTSELIAQRWVAAKNTLDLNALGADNSIETTWWTTTISLDNAPGGLASSTRGQVWQYFDGNDDGIQQLVIGDAGWSAGEWYRSKTGGTWSSWVRQLVDVWSLSVDGSKYKNGTLVVLRDTHKIQVEYSESGRAFRVFPATDWSSVGTITAADAGWTIDGTLPTSGREEVVFVPDNANKKWIVSRVGVKIDLPTNQAGLGTALAIESLKKPNNIHLNAANGAVTWDVKDLADGTWQLITNVATENVEVTFSNHTKVYLRDGSENNELTTGKLTTKPGEAFFVHVTNNAAAMYVNIAPFGGGGLKKNGSLTADKTLTGGGVYAFAGNAATVLNFTLPKAVDVGKNSVFIFHETADSISKGALLRVSPGDKTNGSANYHTLMRGASGIWVAISNGVDGYNVTQIGNNQLATLQAGLGSAVALHQYEDSYKAVHINSASGAVTWDVGNAVDGTWKYLINTGTVNAKVSFANHTKIFIRDGVKENEVLTSQITTRPGEWWIVALTNNAGDIFVNATRLYTQPKPDTSTTQFITGDWTAGTASTLGGVPGPTTTSSTNAQNTERWQAFTAPSTALIGSFKVKLKSDTVQSARVRIYAGSGVGGTVLHESTVSVNTSFDSTYTVTIPTPITLSAGQVYTVGVVRTGGTTGTLTWAATTLYSPDPFPGFSMSDGVFGATVKGMMEFAFGASATLVIKEETHYTGPGKKTVKILNSSNAVVGTAGFTVNETTGDVTLSNPAGFDGSVEISNIDLTTLPASLHDLGKAAAIAITTNGTHAHLEGGAGFSIAASAFADGSEVSLINTTNATQNVAFSGFAGAYLTDGTTRTALTSPLKQPQNTTYRFYIDSNGGSKYLNVDPGAPTTTGTFAGLQRVGVFTPPDNTIYDSLATVVTGIDFTKCDYIVWSFRLTTDLRTITSLVPVVVGGATPTMEVSHGSGQISSFIANAADAALGKLSNVDCHGVAFETIKIEGFAWGNNGFVVPTATTVRDSVTVTANAGALQVNNAASTKLFTDTSSRINVPVPAGQFIASATCAKAGVTVTPADTLRGAIEVAIAAGTTGSADITITFATLGLPKVITTVNSGIDVTCGTLKWRLAGSGNRSLQVSSVSGTATNLDVFTLWSDGGKTDGTFSMAADASLKYLVGWNFTAAGNWQRAVVNDKTNNKWYDVTMVVGASYNANSFVVTEIP